MTYFERFKYLYYSNSLTTFIWRNSCESKIWRKKVKKKLLRHFFGFDLNLRINDPSLRSRVGMINDHELSLAIPLKKFPDVWTWSSTTLGKKTSTFKTLEVNIFWKKAVFFWGPIFLWFFHDFHLLKVFPVILTLLEVGDLFE